MSTATTTTLSPTEPVARPHLRRRDCTGYINSDWTRVSQLIAPGDISGDGIPDLLTVENGTLWLFPGNRSAA